MGDHRTGIAELRARLHDATDTPPALATASAVFEFVIAVAEEHEEEHRGDFPAWAMAAAAATEGWHALAAAPSLRLGRDSNPAPASGDEDELADALARVASQLAACLTAMASQAAHADDTAACAAGAHEAERINDLLARGRP